MAGVVSPSAILPSLSFNPAVGSPLATYASKALTRCSTVGAGAALAASGACARTLSEGKSKPAIKLILRTILFIGLVWFRVEISLALNRLLTFLLRPDAHRLIHLRHKYLAVANLARLGRLDRKS